MSYAEKAEDWGNTNLDTVRNAVCGVKRKLGVGTRQEFGCGTRPQRPARP